MPEAQARHQHASPLGERSFALLFSAVTVSSLGDWASMVALSFGVLAYGTPADLGFVFAAREIAAVALLLVGGNVADRIPRRTLVSSAFLVQGATQLGTAAVLAAHSPSTVSVSALAALSGAASAFGRPAMTSLVPQVVSADRLTRANALLGLPRNLLGLIGAGVGAELVNAAGASAAVALDGASFLLAAALVAALPRTRVSQATVGGVLKGLGRGWRDLVQRRWIWVMIIAFALAQLAFFPTILILGPLIAREHLGGAASWAVILGAEAVGGVVGALVAVRLRPRRPLVVANLVGLGTVVQLLLLALYAPVSAIAGAAFVSGVGFAITDPLWYACLQELVPDEVLGRISGFDWLGSVAVTPVGYVLVGPLAQAWGPVPIVLGASALLLVACTAPLAVSAVRTLELPSNV